MSTDTKTSPDISKIKKWMEEAQTDEERKKRLEDIENALKLIENV